METRYLALCTLDEHDNVLRKVAIKVKWHKKTEKEIKSMFALDLKEQMAEILLEEIRDNLDVDTIKKLLE